MSTIDNNMHRVRLNLLSKVIDYCSNNLEDIFGDVFIKNHANIDRVFILGENDGECDNLLDKMNVLSKYLCASNLVNSARLDALLDIASTIKSIEYMAKGQSISEFFKEV